MGRMQLNAMELIEREMNSMNWDQLMQLMTVRCNRGDHHLYNDFMNHDNIVFVCVDGAVIRTATNANKIVGFGNANNRVVYGNTWDRREVTQNV